MGTLGSWGQYLPGNIVAGFRPVVCTHLVNAIEVISSGDDIDCNLSKVTDD